MENSDADVICLQEVTPFFLQLLTEQDWMRKRYILSDSIGTSLKGSQLAYGVIIAVKFIPRHHSDLHAADSWSKLSKKKSES